MKTRWLSAFSLVEVVVALGVVSFALVALLALLPTGLNLTRESSAESIAANICTDIMSDLKASGGAEVSMRHQIPLTGSGTAGGTNYFDENGRRLTDGSGAIYRAEWIRRARQSTTPAHVHVMVSWPAGATQPQGFVETLAVLETRSN